MTIKNSDAQAGNAEVDAPSTRLDRQLLSNAITGFLFGVTGPLAILLTVGQTGGLSEADLASWIFGSYGLSGVLTLYFCWRYRQPLAMAWTIPGALLLPAAFSHLSFAEVIGAYWVTGLLIVVLGWSGVISWVMQRTPLPIVMGMVAGVFLPLGIKVVTAFTDNGLLASVSLAAFILFSALPALGRRLPAVLAAVLAGGIAAWVTGAIAPLPDAAAVLVRPNLYMPVFSIKIGRAHV